MRYLIRFSYDGTNFFGYQKQPNLRTIEGEFETALYSINNNTETRIYSSGRTDAKVHALNQTAHFDLDIDITLYKLKCALNSLLPDDIHVISTETVDKNFHSRYMAKYKQYKYVINCGEYNPLERNYVYQYNKKLDLEQMNIAINDFIGKHDFKNFVLAEFFEKNCERTIFEAKILNIGNKVIITFIGDGFMKYQVRNMVGTLIKIGSGKLENSIVRQIFFNSENKKFVFTAPPEGLYLEDVKYCSDLVKQKT